MGTIGQVLDGTAQFAVVCGDATAVLKSLPDNSIHVSYSDPPYGLSVHGTDDVLACLKAWMAGEVYTHGKAGMMGAEWDAFVPGPEVWREVHRVLKPGGYCVAFSSTRTVDLLGIAMRLGGLEVRNGWSWVFSQGFPKNLDVGKAVDKQDKYEAALRFVRWMQAQGVGAGTIDEALKTKGLISNGSSFAVHFFNEGQPRLPTSQCWDVVSELLRKTGVTPPEWIAEAIDLRENGSRTFRDRGVVGTLPSSLGGTVAAKDRDPEIIAHHRDLEYSVTAPNTPNAQQWHGWGTDTKPAYEPLMVTRKPLDKTVAHNVLTHGTGALNIHGARVGTTKDVPASGRVKPRDDGWGMMGDESSDGFNPNIGRYPSSVALVHDEGCELVGTRKVDSKNAVFANTEVGTPQGGSFKCGLKRKEHGEYGYADPDGTETVDNWVCTPTCAVAELGRQSGDTRSAVRVGGEGENLDPTTDSWRFKRAQGGFEDSGTAARFFYNAKASAKDRLVYLTCSVGCPHTDTVAPAKSAPKAGSTCPGCGGPVDVYHHPTVKPLSLAQYHAKILSLPPHTKPVAVVPFCGTGVEARALMDVGYRVIAIDLDPRHCAMTEYRLSGGQPERDAPTVKEPEPPWTFTMDDLLGLR